MFGGDSSEIYTGTRTADPPIAIPVMNRKTRKNLKLLITPVAMAENRKSRAITIIIRLRPKKSLGRPIMRTPKADPINVKFRVNPCIPELNWNSVARKGMAPVTTAMSKPNNKPPRLAINVAINKALLIIDGS
jgi:hypothetical protein